MRDRLWVVADVTRSGQAPDPLAQPAEQAQHLVELTSVEDDGEGEELRVIWELEVDAEVIDRGSLPDPRGRELDPPERLAAFMHAVRWGAITTAQRDATLQAPFRSGIAIETYQLEPVVRALRMPRANLLIADDVGLGKTIEAGLVAQELLLRHRARTVLIICPASLTVKWRDEMAEKFGLEFRILDAGTVRDLRRRRGPHANPFTHFPRLIVSIDWLKREHVLRRLREVLPARPTYPRAFDLLIVDEVHTCAPRGTGRYATDSQRTTTLRLLGPHCEHRLFLSATPHNGYTESFTALLELLDPQRFSRSILPTEEQRRRSIVRRLKTELVDDDGNPRFPARDIRAVEIDYPAHERRAHEALRTYAELRAKAAEQGLGTSGRLTSEFVLTLLKKRLFSSPAAFARTLEVHRRTVERQAAGLKARDGGRGRDDEITTTLLLSSLREEVEGDFADESDQEAAWEDALAMAERRTVPLTSEQRTLLDELGAWARGATDRGDAKTAALLDLIDTVVRPHGVWGDERIIVFTEYRDTQTWLAQRMAARGLAGERLAMLHGGVDPESRERIKAAFVDHPALDPVRILLATDAASEGIDLQRHCNQLVHVEIPWNPNRLEQRNGRIDRHGQPRVPIIHHFVGSGWQQAAPQAGTLEADLQFLFVAARKIDSIREDLGTVGPVIADQIVEAMTGHRHTLDTSDAEAEASRSGRLLKIERDYRERAQQLRARLDDSVADLDIRPATILHVVTEGLRLARQPALRPASLERDGQVISDGIFDMPALTGSWGRANIGLAHPVTGARRPITFDHAVAAGHSDVVLVHLGHRLVQQCLRLLRAEVWAAGRTGLTRATARLADPEQLDQPVLLAHGRVVISGGDGRRLHEEVIVAGGRVRDGRFARLNVGEVASAQVAAGLHVPPVDVVEGFVSDWERYAEPLANALEVRARDRAESLRSQLDQRAEEEVAAITEVLTELGESIRAELSTPDVEVEQLSLFNVEERRQFQADLDALRARLEAIPDEIAAEADAIRLRFAVTTTSHFPAAVELLVPGVPS